MTFTNDTNNNNKNKANTSSCTRTKENQYAVPSMKNIVKDGLTLLLLYFMLHIVILITIMICQFVRTQAAIATGAIQEFPSTLSFDIEPIPHRNIVITGANSGLGYQSVELLIQQLSSESNNSLKDTNEEKKKNSVHIVMACRSLSKCETAKKSILLSTNKEASASSSLQLELTCLPLDLASKQSIESFAKSLQHTLKSENASTTTTTTPPPPPLHVLMNNAGQCVPSSSTTSKYIDGIESHIRINHLGHVLLTHLLWPNLEQANGRVIAVSSMAGGTLISTNSGWYPPSNNDTSVIQTQTIWDNFLFYPKSFFFYCKSKRANLYFANELHELYQNNQTNVTTVTTHPGIVSTPIWGDNGFYFLPKWIRDAIFQSTWFQNLFPITATATSAAGAMTQVRAALDMQHISSGDVIGRKYVLWGSPQSLKISDSFVVQYGSISKKETRALWDQSLQAMGIEKFGVSPTVV